MHTYNDQMTLAIKDALKIVHTARKMGHNDHATRATAVVYLLTAHLR